MCTFQKLESGFPAYNGRIQLLRTLHQDIAPFYHQDKGQEIIAQIESLDQQLADLKHGCETLTFKVCQRVNRESVATQAGVTKVSAGTNAR